MGFKVHEELMVAVPHKPGVLAAVLGTVAEAGVDVRAFIGYGMGPQNANIHVIVSDPKKAKAALKKAGYKVESNDVVVGETKDMRGAGAAIAAKAAAKKINIEAAYATGTGKGTGVVVLSAG